MKIFFLLKLSAVCNFWIVLMCWCQKWFLKNKKTLLACISTRKAIWKTPATILPNTLFIGLADFGIWCAFNKQLEFTKRVLLWLDWSYNLVVSELNSEEAWRRIHRLRKGYHGLYYPESIQYKITTSKFYKF